ncbi:MAG: hypothetical protein IPL94_08885 [Tetrasphaera sp.]|nr:hypothetical protein [Tetrasphaera sp.]
MSPLRAGSASRTVPAEDLLRGTAALERAVVTGGRELPQAERVRAEAVIAKASARLGLVGGHTVVALAGATGSGKSSPVQRPGWRGRRHRRRSSADDLDSDRGGLGAESADPLLDWPPGAAAPSGDHEPERHGTLDGLVLLDLPDFDSRVSRHRAEAERILELVDLFVWVTDPQVRRRPAA